MHCCCKTAKCQLFLWLAVCAGGLVLLSGQAAWAVGGTGFEFGNSRNPGFPIDTTNLGDLGLIQVELGRVASVALFWPKTGGCSHGERIVMVNLASRA